MQPAVFLDRDDTLTATEQATAQTAHQGYLADPKLTYLLPGAGEACARLQARGFALVVITNQSGVARGWYSLREVEAVNDRMRELLAAFGVRLSGVYSAPHLPDGTSPPYNTDHPWRKPYAGMYAAAVSELQIDLSRSWSIGDKPRDVQAALTAGIASARCVLIGPPPVSRYESVAAVAQTILETP